MKHKKNNIADDDSIRSLFSKYTDTYYRYAGLQFAIYDYELFENTREMGSPVPEYTRAYREVVRLFFKENEDVLQKYLALRAGIIAKMEAVTAFTDRFTIYEYLLNRAELRFSLSDRDQDPIDDEQVAGALLSRIFRDQDNNTINFKLQTMLEQLPVRLTTDRFFDTLKNSLELYINGQQSSAKKLDYMVRSASGLFKPEGMSYFPDLVEAEKKLEAINYKEITETEFDEASELLQSVITQLTELSEYIGLLENAVNQLGILVFLVPFAGEEAKAKAAGTKELTLWMIDNGDTKEAVPEELVDLFKLGEGSLEVLSETLEKLSAGFDGVADENEERIEALGLSAQSEALEKCRILASDSIYAGLEDDETTDIADEAFIGELFGGLEADLKELFKDKEQKKKRAVMAAVLGELPVFFSSKRAVLDYITNSLRNCSDAAEKRMSIDLLNSAYDELDGI